MYPVDQQQRQSTKGTAPAPMLASTNIAIDERSDYAISSCILIAMATSTELDDDLLWAAHRATVPRPVPPGVHPRNYVELADEIDFEADADDPLRSSRAEAWSRFTHHFFACKDPSFFAEPPPDAVPLKERALWAAIAEALCTRMELPAPEWVYDPRCYLSPPWDPYLIRVTASEQNIEERMAESDPEFRRRNVAAQARDYFSA